MAGIDLTNDRRSELLRQLLAQQGQQRRPIQSGAELAAKLGEQLIRQQTKKKLQQEEAASANTTRANEVAVLQKMMGGGDTDFQGRAITDQQGNQQNNTTLAQALGQLPSGNATGDAISEAMIKQQFAKPEKVVPPKIGQKEVKSGDEIITFRTVDGRLDEELFRAPRKEVSEVRTGPIVNEKKINTDAIESANTSSALRRNIFGTLPEVAANKKSVGVRGNIGLKVGGVATNLLGEAAGNEVAQAIAGNDQGKIAQIQTRLATLRAVLRPITVGDAGARQSETERQLAGKTIGFIDQIQGPSDLAAAFPQVQGALKELGMATLENEYEQAAITSAVDFPFDLNTEDGIIALGTDLSTAGYTLEEAQRVRDRLLRIQNQ